MAVIFFPP